MAQYPDEGAAVDAPSSLTMDEAAAAFDDIFDDEPEGEEPEGEPDESDPVDEGDEPEDADDDSEDDEDEPEAPAIAPPASLTAEEKAAWAQLPPEAQQTLSAIEARRTTEVQKGLETARNAQREAQTAAAGRIAEAERLHAEQLANVAAAYAPKAPDPRLAEQNPAAWIAQKARYDAAKAQHDEFMQHVTVMHGEASKEQERIEAETLTKMWAEVKDDLPEAADQAQWHELLGKLAPIATELGYPLDLLPQATPQDIRAIKRAFAWKEKAEKWDSFQSRKMVKVRNAPKSAKPNAAQPIGSGKARAINSATQRLKQSGSIDDAAAALDRMFR